MKKLTRILCLLLSIVMITALCACQNNNATQTNTTKNPAAEESTSEATQPVTLASDVLEWVDYKEYELATDVAVKNVILMIGDGMGENTILASETVKGDKLVMSSLPYQAHVKTDSLDGTTDSAAASTAISCGIKTRNQYIGVDKDGKAVETLCEFAMAKGMKTGLIDTQVVSHATPAGMVGHTTARSLYNLLTRQMIFAEVDVIMGGGSQYYTSRIERLAKIHNYKYASTEEELADAQVGENENFLGMFAYEGMSATATPSLTTMTGKALDMLDNDNGFFLMVEGSYIDIYAAKLDMAGTLKEMQAFDKAVNTVMQWALEHPGTLVIVTADHETGGVMIPEKATAADINNDCFTSDGEHTSTPVRIMAAGAQADKLFKQNSTFENTEISNMIRKVLNQTYGEKEAVLKSEAERTGFAEDTDTAA